MNLLARWYPLQDVSSLLDWNPSLFRRGNLTPETENSSAALWTPRVDIAEDEKEYLIKVELPEVQKNDVKVTVENGTLSLRGERKAEKEENGRKFHRVECYYGPFERNFSIPEDADADKVTAGYKDGILRVHVAKREKPLPKHIEVQGN